MNVHLDVRNESAHKNLYRSDNLRRLAQLVCESEHIDRDVEISLLFCDDAFMTTLNRDYRKRNTPTDVLSFGELPDPFSPPGHPRVLGDIVISLETVEARNMGDAAAMRDEVRALFCHGLLHLLGYDHQTARGRREMFGKQDSCLGAAGKRRPT